MDPSRLDWPIPVLFIRHFRTLQRHIVCLLQHTDRQAHFHRRHFVGVEFFAEQRHQVGGLARVAGEVLLDRFQLFLVGAEVAVGLEHPRQGLDQVPQAPAVLPQAPGEGAVVGIAVVETQDMPVVERIHFFAR